MKKATLGILLLTVIGWPVAPAASGEAKIVRIVIANADIRLKPNMNSPVIAVLPIGTTLDSPSQVLDWFQVNLPPDEQGIVVSGYIHQSAVEVVETVAPPQPEPQPPVEPKPIAPPQPLPLPQGEREPDHPGENFFSGSFIKFGWIFKPEAGSFENSWLASVGIDLGLDRNFALGLEIQPTTRNYKETDIKIFSILGLVNLKSGFNLGGLFSFLKFINLWAGGGAGVEANFKSIGVDGERNSEFATNFAYHILGGLDFILGGITLIAEYQMTKVSDAKVAADEWRHCLLFGLRF